MLTILRPENDADRPAARWSPIYHGLRDAIVGHRLAPGTKLPEDELASIYSVSRTVIRAALQALAHDRLVRLEPNRGAFVAQPSPKEAREVFEARALIEPKVAALAAEAAGPGDVMLLRRHLEKEHEARDEGRDSEAILLSARFHVGVAEIADHSVLTELVRDLVSHSSLIIALYWKRRDTTCECHAHQALVDAIEAGEANQAAALMNSHLVDLLSGLDLARASNKAESLANILR
ncbi:GntR family transcriptional regulator [Mesorhizobium sp. CC13]|uniref:GntR family transcriptional regulator n=1 Tax=Mesorhizobium sp. CC13 TaxID=3029194 RepID=UPI0032642A48